MKHPRSDSLFGVKSAKGSAKSRGRKGGTARDFRFSGDGVERPCSVGIRSERVEAGGGDRRVRPGCLWEAWQTRRARVAGSAVYLSFARLGTSRPPQCVQVETRLAQGGASAASVSTPGLERRAPSQRQTHLGQDRIGVDPFDVRVCQSGCF